MRIHLVSLLCLPLLAQVPRDLGPAFFSREPKLVMVECADIARSREGKDSRMLAKCGHVYLAAGERARAEEAFALALKDDPKDGITRYLIGLAWLRNGFKSEALSSFSKIPPDKNDLAKAACRLAEARMATEAEEMMTKAWNLDRQDWENCSEFGKAALLNGLPELAAIWFKRTLEAAPKDWCAWNSISLAYAELSAHQRAEH